MRVLFFSPFCESGSLFMASLDNINEQLAGINIEDEENEELIFDDDLVEDSNKFELCLVGRFATEKGINTRAMKTKLADVWRPVRGISIKDLKPGIFLFQFYHVEDLQWVLNGGPWSFDGAMLIVSAIKKGEDPCMVPLFELQFWIQIHGLPSSFMSEAIGKQLGNFFGVYLSYDPNNNTSIWRESMRLKIKVDVRKPLKRKKKICRRDGSEVIVQCKYEKLGDFCFVCGLVTHTERFCRLKLESNVHEVAKEWGSWLRAPPRRAAGQEKSKWLRDERDEDWGKNLGDDNYYQQFSGGQMDGTVKENSQKRYHRANLHGGVTISGSKDMIENSNFPSSKQAVIQFNGPTDEELNGLNIEERKRRRSGPSDSVFMDTECNNKELHTDAVLSNKDCAASSTNVLAMIALQASQGL